MPLPEALLLRRGDHSRPVEIWRDQNETEVDSMVLKIRRQMLQVLDQNAGWLRKDIVHER
jgi:hypothetical protein